MRGSELVDKVRGKRPLVADLARALSLSASIDVALVRGMRAELFDRADVTTEMDLWSSPLVQTRSGTEFTLRDDVLSVFWVELGERRQELARCWLALEKLRPQGRPLRRLEEQLTRLAIESDRAGIDESLSSVVTAMLESEARRRDLSAWSARVLARLPALVRECETARILGSAAAGWVATPKVVATLTPLPENARLAYKLRPDNKLVEVAIRRIGDVLEVGRSFAVPKVTLSIPMTNPVLIIDEDTTHVIDLRGLTRIPLTQPRVMIGTSDGRRFLLGPESPRPNTAAIASIFGESDAGVAYLVAPNLAVSSARQLKNSVYHLTFGTQTARARVVSLDTEADIALLELASPLSTQPLRLQPDVRQGETWQALEVSRGSMLKGATSQGRWSGTVATAWPNVTVRLAGDEVTEALARPGMPIFVGDQVIAHLRSDVQPRAVLHTTSARLVEWWLAHQSRLSRTQSAPKARRSSAESPRVWIVSQTSREVPNSLRLSSSHPAAADDFVMLFARERRLTWPAALYRAMNVYPPAVDGLNCHLSVALPRLHEETLHELQPYILPVANAPEDRDTRSLKIHHQLVELIARVGRADEYDQTQLFRCLDAPRGAQDAMRHVPVLLRLPARISTAGLLGVELVQEGIVQCFRSHRWGRHPVEISVGNERHDTRSLCVKIGYATGSSEGPELTVSVGNATGKERFAQACTHALHEFSGATMIQPAASTSEFDLEVEVQCLPGMSPAYACRRGITFLLEALAALDAYEPERAVYFHAPGIGKRDIAEIQGRASASHPGVTFVWIDPETDIVRLNLNETADETLAYGAMEDSVLSQYYGKTSDPVAGRFGLSPTRNGRSISVSEFEASAHVSVQGIDDRPIRGYVTFYYAAGSHGNRRMQFTRVRASKGVADCELQAFDQGSAVGAIVEDEGIVLERQVREKARSSQFSHSNYELNAR